MERTVPQRGLFLKERVRALGSKVTSGTPRRARGGAVSWMRMSDPNDLHIKRLEILQSIITRMAQNSFTIKGWAVTVMTALLAFSNKDSDRWFAAYALYPAMAFWGLDAYYLMQERLFRELSKQPAKSGEEFDFKTTPTAGGFFAAAFSPTVLPLYAFSVLMALLIAFFR
jgi:hypothetical protein